jgi:hypothetical protein
VDWMIILKCALKELGGIFVTLIISFRVQLPVLVTIICWISGSVKEGEIPVHLSDSRRLLLRGDGCVNLAG